MDEAERWQHAITEFSCPFCGRAKGRACVAIMDPPDSPRDLVRPHEPRLKLLGDVSSPERRGVIQRTDNGPDIGTVNSYLWSNFYAVPSADLIMIVGVDRAGFTLEAQRDRLASGLIAMEIVR